MSGLRKNVCAAAERPPWTLRNPSAAGIPVTSEMTVISAATERLVANAPTTSRFAKAVRYHLTPHEVGGNELKFDPVKELITTTAIGRTSSTPSARL
jgi:hypothetical protein